MIIRSKFSEKESISEVEIDNDWAFLISVLGGKLESALFVIRGDLSSGFSNGVSFVSDSSLIIADFGHLSWGEDELVEVVGHVVFEEEFDFNSLLLLNIVVVVGVNWGFSFHEESHFLFKFFK